MGSKNKRAKETPSRSVLARRIIERWADAVGDVTLDRVMAELGDAQRYDIVASLKELEREGAGEFMVGRSGQKARFVWKRARPRPSRPLAKIVEQKAVKGRAVPPRAKHRLEHEFQLRRGVVATVSLPPDVTRAELERLCRFLRAIPLQKQSSREG